MRLGHRVEVGGRDAWADRRLDHVEHLGRDATGLPHPLDLGSRLAGHHQATPASATAAMSASVTSSIGMLPSTLASTPRDR